MIGTWILLVTASVVGAIAALPKVIYRFGRRLEIGNRIRIRGGYEEPPQWLQGRPAVTGSVIAFVPEENGRTAAAIVLDEPLTMGSVPHAYLLLRLRYEHARWRSHEIVHVEAWADTPTNAQAGNPNAIQHEWLESHAAYKVIG